VADTGRRLSALVDTCSDDCYRLAHALVGDPTAAEDAVVGAFEVAGATMWSDDDRSVRTTLMATIVDRCLMPCGSTTERRRDDLEQPWVQLPEPMRAALAHAVFGRCDIASISEIIDAPPSDVACRIRVALSFLRANGWSG